MKHMTLLTVLFSFSYLLGCERSAETPHLEAITNAPRIAIGPHDTILNVWYVEGDGVGHTGYACVYSSLSVPNPGGKGLFQSLEALRNEIHLNGFSGMSIVSKYQGIVPNKWKIRDLTEAELRFLRAEK